MDRWAGWFAKTSTLWSQTNLQRSGSVLKSVSLGFVVLMVGLPGCSWLRNDSVKQFQAENERLIQDYRVERDKAERLEIENRALVSRVYDLEGRIGAISDAIRNPAFDVGREQLTPSGGVFRPASQPGKDSEGARMVPQQPAADAWQANQ
jgi:hypothetical protein